MLIKGIVVAGFGEGKQIGYPTANLNLAKKSDKAEVGVYVGWVKINNLIKPGILIVGVYEDKKDLSRHEVYIIDWSEAVYGNDIEFEPVKKIRDIIKMANRQALIKQIELDIIQAKEILGV